MSADPTLTCSPASCMSGGDYDGDDVIIIGLPSIVNAVEAVNGTMPTQDSGLGKQDSPTAVVDVLRAALCKNETYAEAIEKQLLSSCMQAVKDVNLKGALNTLWLKNADLDLSQTGKFGDKTLKLVRLQELAMDASKTGWTIDQSDLTEFRAPMPHWAAKHRHRNEDGEVLSSSILGQLWDAEPKVDDWIVMTRHFGPRFQEGHSLMKVAKERTALLRDEEKTQHLQIFNEALEEWKFLKSENYRPDAASISFQKTVEIVREHWIGKVERKNRHNFALTAYVDKEGILSRDCWELCFEELCSVFAEQCSVSSTHNYVTYVARGAPVTLRANSSGHGTETVPSFGPAPRLVEQTRVEKVLRNLQLMRGPADGGDLSYVPREQYEDIQVDDVRFTHDTISSRFKDGQLVQSLVDKLRRGEVNLSTPGLSIDVVQFDGHLWSLRNRRLFAFKEYQRQLRAESVIGEEKVKVRICVLPLTNSAVMAKFIDCFSTQSNGLSVTVE
eukprot:TRINITY_DN84144_c0_g1_i1.p1 TRINITY_DN84144_c0_g1~~TRINITY_DN84144_c0_g1_i1.p1  ORF type:complete len:515 (+),score=81.19 TRINITY_DN84144_c0_g1_i1:47-1546(+)